MHSPVIAAAQRCASASTLGEFVANLAGRRGDKLIRPRWQQITIHAMTVD